jgi:hypothetical protein
MLKSAAFKSNLLETFTNSFTPNRLPYGKDSFQLFDIEGFTKVRITKVKNALLDYFEK